MKITLLKKYGTISPYSEADAEQLATLSDAVYVIDIKNMDSRTLAQNNALHLWASQIAMVLNVNNLYMNGIFQNDIMWTMELVKTQIIKGLIKTLFNIDSTTKLKRKELDTLIDYITAIFGEKKGIKMPEFPNRKLWDEIKK
jgi:hypothetical protein